MTQLPPDIDREWDERFPELEEKAAYSGLSKLVTRSFNKRNTDLKSFLAEKLAAQRTAIRSRVEKLKWEEPPRIQGDPDSVDTWMRWYCRERAINAVLASLDETNSHGV